MSSTYKVVEQNVTYTLEVNGNLIVIGNVPARVKEETGEQLCAPETVEHLQKLCLGVKEIQEYFAVPVYEYM